MADLSRVGHIARAQELLAEADQVLALRREFDATPEQSREAVREAACLSHVARGHAAVAALLVEHEDAEAAPLWVPATPGVYNRQPCWSLIRLDEDSSRRPVAGWYLFGPGSYEHGCFTAETITLAQTTADRVIKAYYASHEADS